jgi:hypothetical protein
MVACLKMMAGRNKNVSILHCFFFLIGSHIVLLCLFLRPLSLYAPSDEGHKTPGRNEPWKSVKRKSSIRI